MSHTYVPGCRNDYFVSYAQVNDLTYPGVEFGWVATLEIDQKSKAQHRRIRSAIRFGNRIETEKRRAFSAIRFPARLTGCTTTNSAISPTIRPRVSVLV